MNWRDVDVPERMMHLPRDRRGFPVPFIVMIDPQGVPVFTVNDTRKTHLCLRNTLCGVCGGELEFGDLWWIGGPLSSFHPNGAFVDGPMHEECSTYALQVCPHLGAPKYVSRMNVEKEIARAGVNYGFDHTVMPDRPEVFIQGQSISYDVSWPLTEDRKLFPVSGYHETPDGLLPKKWEYYDVWRHGEVLEEEEGITAIREAIEKAQQGRVQKPRIIVPDRPDLIV